MNFHSIATIARYETKILSRSWSFRLFVTLTLVIVFCLQIIQLFDISNNPHLLSIDSLAAEIPFSSFEFINIMQSLIALFVVMESSRRSSSKDTLETIRVRPISNIEQDCGKILGWLKFFSIFYIACIFITLVFHLFIGNTPFQLKIYIFYLFFWTLPTLIFTIGVSLCIVKLTRHTGMTLALAFFFSLLVTTLLSSWQHGSFDLFANKITVLFSDMYGYPNPSIYILQRCMYLFIGISLIIISLTIQKRIPNKKSSYKITIAITLPFLFTGIVCGMNYYHDLNLNSRQRETYKQIYKQLNPQSRTTILQHNIQLRQRTDSIYLSSEICLKNTNKDTINQIILYLNPSLHITRITSGKKTLTYNRKEQVVIVSKILPPDTTLSLKIMYKGTINENICYLDVPDLEYYKSSRCQRFAYTEDKLTLLTPECMWYPTTIPPVSLHNNYEVAMAFSRFSLTVHNPGKKTVITQGRGKREKNKITFTNEHNLPGISLIIGCYEKKTIRAGNIDFELYNFSGQDYFSTYFPRIKATSIEKVLDRQMACYRIDFNNYPYRKLALVETPVHFHSWYREWKNSSEFVQPEILFLSEKGHPLKIDFQKAFAQFKNNDHKLLDVSAEEEVLFSITSKLFNLYNNLNDTWYPTILNKLHVSNQTGSISSYKKNKYYINSLLSSGNLYIYSSQFPIIDKTFKLIREHQTKLISFNTYQTSRGSFNPEAEACTYLSKHSFKEALRDTSLPYYLQNSIIRQKAKDLWAYILSQTSANQFYLFMDNLFSTYNFEEVPLDTLLFKLEQATGVKLSNYLHSWYHSSGLPGFQIKEVSFTPAIDKDQNDIQVVSIKLHNIAPASGNIIVHHGNFLNPAQNFFHIQGGAYNEIRFHASSSRISLFTGLSQNNPGIFNYTPGKNDISVVDTLQGIFNTDSTIFIPNPNEIIVDNQDPDFKIISPSKSKRWFELFKASSTSEHIEQWETPYQRPQTSSKDWKILYGNNSHGDIIQSVYHKLSGQGEYKAVWEIDIPQAGEYDLFFYHNNLHWSIGDIKIDSDMKNGKLYYTVYTPDEKREIILETETCTTGWNPIATFHLPRGKTSVTLDDRGVSRQIICADAIKWVRKL